MLLGAIRGGDCKQTMRGNEVVLYTMTNETRIHICEIEIWGYRYAECVEYEREFYYGPSCELPCHCETQCHYITGKYN